MSFRTMFETPESEQARLASLPVGSRNHELSKLPVTVGEWPEGLPIVLPQMNGAGDHKIAVVPIEHRSPGEPARNEDGSRHRHAGAWNCIAVASDHPSYQPGGHNIVVAASELARGRKLDLMSLL